ncbi:putative sulfite oxidase [metagenome]|uniref:Putative sulfite oxidase n=1 Tax=metagenome TaxID=256318 RepID=A0A2P2BVW4_9ZZZZ
MRPEKPPVASRRTFLAATALAGGAALTPLRPALAEVAPVADGPILKPLPPEAFIDLGTNAEMRWDSVLTREFRTRQSRLFVRNHTATPLVAASSYALRIFGDGLSVPRGDAEPLSLTLRDLRRLPHTSLTAVHECTGNGRSFFGTQQGAPAAGTQWTLGAVGTVRWEGVRLADVLRRVGISPAAVSVQGAGLDANYVSGGVDYGAVRRPLPIAKALDDALLAWGMNGEPLLPDHGFPLRLVVPGWVGIASIKWLGSLEVSTTELTSPWNTKWYRMSGPGIPADSPPLTENPVRSAWELAWNAQLTGRSIELTGRSWSGAGPVRRIDVSTDGGATWSQARLTRPGHRDGWTPWAHTWRHPAPGAHELMARATDVTGRTQPFTALENDGGYFFDAVVRHPVTVVA